MALFTFSRKEDFWLPISCNASNTCMQVWHISCKTKLLSST